MAEGDVCVPLIAEGITLEMLAYLTRKKLTPETRAPKWLGRVVERLNDEFTENISSEELALEANVHPVHLASVFRRFYHQTIGEYVQKKRVAHASELLLNREIPLTEIAYSAGFSDQSHFTRVFRRFTGLTPGAFRRSVE
jgi:AraC family transcriptional regulator